MEQGFATIINTQQADKNIQQPFVEQKHTGLWLYVEAIKRNPQADLKFPNAEYGCLLSIQTLSYFAHLLRL
ncbi:hypothetical protein ACT691_19535 [Vibrio metschnikovii]